ncbi:MAG TPA: metallopeptidase family protein [Candidatus Microsaccharimonas sp.]|nr:metallopeptidase family protein [Candidatus Microsaccharimonas sp.]
MLELSDDRFQQLIDEALGELPKRSLDHLKNVAILFADEPSEEQREKLKLLPYQSLYGLYEGIPLPFRQGQHTTLPDRITLFKLPILGSSNTEAKLKEQIKHTLWHEVAHYYGLNHDQIHAKES